MLPGPADIEAETDAFCQPESQSLGDSGWTITASAEKTLIRHSLASAVAARSNQP